MPRADILIMFPLLGLVLSVDSMVVNGSEEWWVRSMLDIGANPGLYKEGCALAGPSLDPKPVVEAEAPVRLYWKEEESLGRAGLRDEVRAEKKLRRLEGVRGVLDSLKYDCEGGGEVLVYGIEVGCGDSGIGEYGAGWAD